MSSAEVAASLVKKLEPEDWKVLHGLERALVAYEEVPLHRLVKGTKLHKEEVEYRLKRLNEANLIVHGPRGYTLLTAGLDAIALRAFTKKGFIKGMGKALGVGKEADVFEAIGERGELYAIKFYRIGRISFRDIRRKRAYISPLHQHPWLLVNIQAAKREFWALSQLKPYKISGPDVIAQERHAILMKKIEGSLLPEWPQLPEPVATLKQILKDIRTAYVDAQIVNGDLSEFNILFDGKKPWIIDWPQAIPSSHPNATILLDRDVVNIVKFFKRRYDVKCPIEPASFYVRGWRDSVEVRIGR
ncbi:MAG: RIO1 family regulatory kinase/ATPase [Nitrososphaerota archaeon]